MVRWLCAWLFLCISPLVAQPYSGPPNGADYWTVQGFKEFPVKGPQAAQGLILWSHGVKGREAQYGSPPAPVIKRFARAGWDVVKVQRDPRNERGWIPSGVRHVNDLVDRVNKARADGYRHIIAAGQSYGGAISIEAAAKTADIDGVIALAPGHGSDAAGDGRARRFDTLTDQLIGAIAKAKTPRLLVMIAEGDIYTPFEVRGPKLRAALQKRGQPFVLFEETMPLKGHGAGTRPQFDQWYGACIQSFMTKPDMAQGETRCEGPMIVGKFALPRDVKITAPAIGTPANLASLSGRWSGNMSDKRGIILIFEKVDEKRVAFVYALAPAPDSQSAPSWVRRTANWNGTTLESRNKNDQFSIVFPPPGPDGVLGVVVTGERGTVFQATLHRDTGL